MTAGALDSATKGLLLGLDLLFLGLTALSVASAAHSGANPWVAALLGSGFVGTYVAGRAAQQVELRPLGERRARWWPDGAWNLLLGLGWLAMLWLTDNALWLAFPLMLIQLHTLGPRFGLGAVAVTTAVAAAFGLRHGLAGLKLGSVLGPVVGSTVAVGVVFGLESLASQNERRQQLLDELNQTRSYLAEAERENAVLGERERLAREIHDTLAQGFSAINLLLRAAEPQLEGSPARTLVVQAASTARDNLAEARRLIRALAPAALQRDTLASALQHACTLSQELQPSLRSTMEVTGIPVGLPMAIEATLLRVAQSGLANVVQHAQASQAHLRLDYGEAEVSLTLTDDGAGFQPAQMEGFGLRGMRSRATELGGSCEVTSSPGQGAKLRLVLPVPEEEAQR
ncbi:Sensor protein vraS [Actinomyces bovis]|uniref:Oxygen sensor histidine kinase NreB n=1 Tax=Actinomyces bovis TaxID=1658 RepID=A0ABY1VR72_9ACTO|nr:sensor histidine kinase [Actinomyces bovis]SPT54182.1 Sensor protein vraS [Actinomyces bovis]VEG56592.1 Sensor protein vraS [Actinomyces israelii]